MINIRKRGNIYQYCFEAGKVNGKRKQITKSGFRTKNEAYLLRLYQKSQTKDSLRNYQKVIKSSLRDATNYFGFLKYNPVVELQVPKNFSFETKKTE